MITSPANERIKSIRKLQERKARQESGLFSIEGLRITGEAIEQGAAIEMLVAAPELLVSHYGQDLVEKQKKRGVEVLEVSTDVFQRIALKEGPQGLAAVVRQAWTPIEAVTLEAGKTWVALESVADPGNLGTILRTHDATGGSGVMLLEQSTDPYDPSAVRASMGAIFSQRLVRASFAAFADWKQRANAYLIGTSGAAKVDYHDCRYPPAPVILMGSERQGLQDQHLAICDEVVSIPMAGKASDSLNLAVATAVVLYEVFNQRRDRGTR
jgi:RNA methyltransferase, TrmH family